MSNTPAVAPAAPAVIKAEDLLAAASIMPVKPAETKVETKTEAKKRKAKSEDDEDKPKAKKNGKRDKLAKNIELLNADITAFVREAIQKRIGPFAGIKKEKKPKKWSNWKVFMQEKRPEARIELKKRIDAGVLNKEGKPYNVGVGAETAVLGEWWAQVAQSDKDGVWNDKALANTKAASDEAAAAALNVVAGSKRKREEGEADDEEVEEPPAKRAKKEKKEPKPKKEKKEPKPKKEKKSKTKKSEDADDTVEAALDQLDGKSEETKEEKPKKGKGKGKGTKPKKEAKKKDKTAADLKSEPLDDISSDDD